MRLVSLTPSWNSNVLAFGLTDSLIWHGTVASRFYRQISSYLTPSPSNPKPFQTPNLKILPNGLASVEEGLALMKNDKLHGEKLVYLIANTPGIAT